MTLPGGGRGLGLPTTHYFVSVSRGDAIRTATLTPVTFWAAVALLPASLGFGLAGVFELASVDRFPGVAVSSLAEIGPSPRTEETDARVAADADALEARLRGVIDREIRLEKRAAVVGALAQEAARGAPKRSAVRSAPDAVGAIETLAPKIVRSKGPMDALEDGAARAYAPSAPAPPSGPAEPRPPGNTLGRREPASAPPFGTLATNPNLDPSTRLAFVDRSLDRIESGQLTALAAVDHIATEGANRDRAILADAGLDAAKLAARHQTPNAGGPFVPVDVSPAASGFDRALARAAHDVAFAAKLRALMAYVPLGQPLEGETRVASPFGYRIDPFIGRPALHMGVDLVQPYGAEIRATGAGRIVQTGLIPGYGLMVEIDHGDGLSSRYAHLSKILGRRRRCGRAGRGRRKARLDRPRHGPSSPL